MKNSVCYLLCQWATGACRGHATPAPTFFYLFFVHMQSGSWEGVGAGEVAWLLQALGKM